MYAPPLQKGDIFFWGSRIIHGSTPGTDPRLRRRSIAAHFVPDGFSFGNLERDFSPTCRERYGLRYACYGLDIEFEKQNAGPVGRFAERVKSFGGRVRSFAGRVRRVAPKLLRK
jgi:hypothetical protein